MIDDGKLKQFIGQLLGDLGGASSVAMVRIGDALGLYKALHARGAMTSSELATAAGADERYLREWLSNQAASNYSRTIRRPEIRASAGAGDGVRHRGQPGLHARRLRPDGGMLDNQPKVEEAFRTGGGIAWGEQAGCMFCAVARFFRPGYHKHLIGSWLPALDGVVEKLSAAPRSRMSDAATVVDGDDGKAFPNSQFIGYDFHPESIGGARRTPRRMGHDNGCASRTAWPRIFRATASTS